MTIKEYRTKRGMTQKQLAQEAKVSEKCIRDLEEGHRLLRNAKTSTALQIAKALDVTVEELAGKQSNVNGKVYYESDFEWWPKEK